jgi:TniQ
VQLDLSAPLPIVPPPEEDELISSWLDRIARFYGVPAWELFGLTRGRRVLSLSTVDLGTSEPALAVIAARLGITNRQLAIHTIAGAYPWAVNLVAIAPQKPTRGYPQRIRYAACPICLEHQKVERGFSWLRREWVLAARTVCPLHNDFLLESDEGPIVHPAWSDFARVHRNVQQPTTPATRSSTIAVALPEPGSLTSAQQFHQTIATVEGTTLLLLARRRGRGAALRPHNAEEEFALRVQDLIWAFTRSDDLYGDRIVYDAVACERLDDAWHISRRRHPGPLNFNGLSLRFRHLLVVTATLLLGPRPQLEAFYGYATSLEDELGIITRRLSAADRHSLAQRLTKWSGDTEHR